MSGFTGRGGGGGGGIGACAAYGVGGNVEVASQAQVDQRVAVGVLCPLFIGPAQNRLKVVTVGSGIQLLNQVGAYPNNAGPRAIDWQAWRTAITQVASVYYSTAVGQSNRVDGASSVAVGYHNHIYSAGAFPILTRSHAFGSENIVNGYRSVAIGHNNNILGDDNVAIGQNILMNNIGPLPVITCVAIGNYVVAGGNYAVAIGNGSQVNFGSVYGTAVGMAAIVFSATHGVAVGAGANVTGTRATAVGGQTSVTGHYSSAFGTQANARIDRTHVHTAPNIIRKDDGEALADSDLFFAGHDFVIMTPEVDFQAAAADYPISLPAGCSFWINEVGVILTTLDIPGNVATQPTVRFGIAATPAKWMAPTLCTLLDVLRHRERFNLLLTDDGETSMSFGVTAPGSLTVAGTYLGRAYFKGTLVENE